MNKRLQQVPKPFDLLDDFGENQPQIDVTDLGTIK